MSTASLYVIAGLTGKGTQPTPPAGRAGAANEIAAAAYIDQSGGIKGRFVGGDAPPQDWWRLSGEVTHGDGFSDGISFKNCISFSQMSLTCSCPNYEENTILFSFQSFKLRFKSLDPPVEPTKKKKLLGS